MILCICTLIPCYLGFHQSSSMSVRSIFHFVATSWDRPVKDWKDEISFILRRLRQENVCLLLWPLSIVRKSSPIHFNWVRDWFTFHRCRLAASFLSWSFCLFDVRCALSSDLATRYVFGSHCQSFSPSICLLEALIMMTEYHCQSS